MSISFRYFKSSPEIIQSTVLLYVRYSLSLRNVEEILAERGIDISYETVRFWWNRFGPLIANQLRKGVILIVKTTQTDGGKSMKSSSK
jgi:putative transposase